MGAAIPPSHDYRGALHASKTVSATSWLNHEWPVYFTINTPRMPVIAWKVAVQR